MAAAIHYLLIFCLLAGAGWTSPACAEGVLDKPYRIIVPLGPGSASDLVARLLAEAMSEGMGGRVLVENRPGAAGGLAVTRFKLVEADGRTALLAPLAIPVLIALASRNKQLDPLKDLAPISQVATFEFALAVHAGHPARSVEELLQWAASDDRRSAFATPGGGLPHLFGLSLARASGVNLVHVPYPSGSAAAMAVIGDHVPIVIAALADLLPLQRSNKLRILAVSGTQRSALVPQIPTFSEQGFAAIQGTSWVALFAPPGTPAPMLRKWATGVTNAVRNPAFRERLLQLGLEPTGTSDQELREILRSTLSQWEPLIKATGFQLD